MSVQLVQNFKDQSDQTRGENKQAHLQHGIADATTMSGDTRVVFSPNSVSAAGNERN